MQVLKSFLKDESGATAIEYGLIAAAIALVLVTILPNISTNLTSVFSQIDEGLSEAITNGTAG
jgi:pilus assembly protein Flp/PilA